MAGSVPQSSQVSHVRVECGSFGTSRVSARLQRRLINIAIGITDENQLDIAPEPYDELARRRKRIVFEAHIGHLQRTASLPDA